MKQLTKTQSERIHAKQRAKERYDLDLNRHDLQAIVDIIQDNRSAEFVRATSLRVSVFKLPYKGKLVCVAYDKMRKTIVTFLPLKFNMDQVTEGN